MTTHPVVHQLDPLLSSPGTTEPLTHDSCEPTHDNRSLIHNKIYQSITSPTPHDNPTTPLAERRKTQVSNYLVSQDFKTDFAIKLNHLRQRELNLPAATVTAPITPTTTTPTTTTTTTSPATTNLSYTTPKHTPHHQEKMSNTSRGHLDNIGMMSSTNSKSRFAIPFSDQNSLKEEPETEDCSSASSMQKGILSCRSSVRANEDPEEQNARYEVIRKLADQLAEQIEENDHLLYELGVVRSNNARLKSLEVDQEDELTCLHQRIRHLESIIATTGTATNNDNDNHINSWDTSRSNNHASSKSSNTQPQTEIQLQYLKSQLKQVRTTLCQIQSDLNPSINRTNPQSIRHSWPSVSPKPTWTTTNQETNQNELIHLSTRSPHCFSSVTDPKDFDFLNKIHQLEVELFECNEARIISGVTLQALINSIDKDCDAIEESEKPTEIIPDMDSEQTQEGLSTTSLGLESEVLDKEVLHVKINPLLDPTIEAEPPAVSPPSNERPQSCATNVSNSPTIVSVSSSPLMSLATFSFSGWGRKVSDTTAPSSTQTVHEEVRKIPSRLISVSDHQSQQASALLSPPIIEQLPALKTLGSFRFLFNYSSTPTHHNNNNEKSASLSPSPLDHSPISPPPSR